MNFFETFRVALTALSTNRLRALLTTLGIMIGVAAVVTLMSLGDSLQGYITSQFASVGADILQVSAARGRNTASGTQPLTTTEAEGLLQSGAAPMISGVAWTYSLQGTVSAGDSSASLSIQGVTANYADVNNWQPETGRFINAEDITESSRVALLDQTTASDLFGTADPVGQTAFIRGQIFTIIGVMEERSITGLSQQMVLIPVSTAQSRLANVRVAGKGYRVSSIQIKVISTESEAINTLTDQVEAYFLRAHGISNPNAADFSVFSAATILDSLSSTLSLITVFLSVIAGISLLVGGIGVMNIMLVSVTERTREIGLRKAVGAQFASIMTQFLLESILLSLFGGLIGIVLATTLLTIAGLVVTQLTIAVSPSAAVLATGISTLIGILSGVYPARRAAVMNPIQALRFE
ncbi:MAG: ABC transporter permease [Chloroflexi bacterium]|nr:ABC transporter permease [Chloroflexota bacterium]MCC6891832.1 ABC transporter permease [Anaerolineae bacterium]